MRLTRRILLATILLCLTLGVAVFAVACKKAPATYAVTYAFGSCEDVEYAGNSALPTEGKKKAEEKFPLADALIWEGYTFKGWNDGDRTYAAGAQYTMPAKAVKLTAMWEKGSEFPTSHSVVYHLGGYDDTAYGGTGTLPEESVKDAGEAFSLASAPVWNEYYVFVGWSDGTATYGEGETYTMPGEDVAFTAQWRFRGSNVSSGNVLPWWTAGTFETTISNGTTTTFEVIFGGATEIYQGLLADVYANGDNYRLRVDPYFFTNLGDSTFDSSHGTAQYVETDASAWDENAYLSLFKNGGKAIQVVTASLNNNVLTYTISAYRASDTALRSPVVSTTFRLRSATSVNSMAIAFYRDTVALDKCYLLSNQATQKATFTFAYESNQTAIYSDLVAGSVFTFVADPVKEGYTFLGWQAYGKGAFYKQGQRYTVGREDIIFLPAWADEVKITVDKNGGTGTVETPAFNYNELTGKLEYALPSSANLTKENYVFKGWEVSVNGSVISVGSGTFSVEPGSIVVIKALWATSYSVTYSAGSCDGNSYAGSSLHPVVAYRAEGETFYVAAALSWKGYDFLGWSDGKKIYQAGDLYSMGAENVIFTAQWSRHATYTVTYLAGECEGEAADPILPPDHDSYLKSVGEEFALPRALVWEGYDFLGWNDGTTTYDALYRPYTMPAHDVTFTAQWSKRPTHVVTYLNGAAEGETVDNMPENGTPIQTALRQYPVRYGYTFTGWSDGKTVYKIGSVPEVPKEGLTLTAQWEALSNNNYILISGYWQCELNNADNDIWYLHISGTAFEVDMYSALAYTDNGYINLLSYNAENGLWTFTFNKQGGFTSGGYGNKSGTSYYGYNPEDDTILAYTNSSRSSVSKVYTRVTQKHEATASTSLESGFGVPTTVEYALPVEEKKN